MIQSSPSTTTTSAAIGLDAVLVDTTSWREYAADPRRIVWVTEAGDVVSLNFFERRPDLAAPPHAIGGIRDQYRAMLGEQGGIIELETDRVDELPAVRSILKVVQKPAGRTYIGALTVPRAGFSHVLKIESVEHDPSCSRELAVYLSLASRGQVHLTMLDMPAAGWAMDPYDPAYQAPVLRNCADDESWDALFPDHPLTRCRRILRRLRETTRLSDAIRLAPPFETDEDD